MKDPNEKAKYKARVLSMVVNLDHEPIFADTATTVTILDEAAGEFLEVSQSSAEGYRAIRICSDEWPFIRDTIDHMFSLIGVEK